MSRIKEATVNNNQWDININEYYANRRKRITLTVDRRAKRMYGVKTKRSVSNGK